MALDTQEMEEGQAGLAQIIYILDFLNKPKKCISRGSMQAHVLQNLSNAGFVNL